MADDVVRLICPNLKCRTVLSVPGHARGKTVRCRGCGARIRIPRLSAPKSVPVPPSAAAPASGAPNEQPQG